MLQTSYRADLSEHQERKRAAAEELASLSESLQSASHTEAIGMICKQRELTDIIAWMDTQTPELQRKAAAERESETMLRSNVAWQPLAEQ